MMKENFFQYVQTLSGSASTTLNLNKKNFRSSLPTPTSSIFKKEISTTSKIL